MRLFLAVAVALAFILGPAAGGEAGRGLAASTDPVHRLVAADLAGLSPGVLVLPGAGPDDVPAAFYEITPGDLMTVVDVADQPFRKAVRIAVPKPGPDYWNQHVKLRSAAPIGSGSVVYYTFWVRNLVGGVTGKGKWNQNVMAHDWGPDFTIPDRWTRKHFWFRAPQDIPAGGLEWMLSFGFDGNTGVELGGFTGVVLPPGTDPAKLPAEVVVTTYPGRAATAAWRAAAAERIEKHRKADLAVEVVDADGKPVRDATIAVAMTRHAFPFSTCVDLPVFPGVTTQPYGFWGELDKKLSASDKAKYLEVLDGWFSAAMAGPSWWLWSGAELDVEDGAAAVRWLRERGLEVQGHEIVYRAPYWPKAAIDALNAKDKPAVAAAIDAFLADWARRFGEQVTSASFVNEWDINPVRHLFATAEDPEGYGEALRWYKTLGAKAPKVKLGINDPGPSSAYKARIRWLQDRGARLSWIGFQWHLSIPGIAPEQVLAYLDEYAALGVTIEASELDFAIPDPKDPAQVAWQRDYLRDLYTVLFSHPAVSGITKWGFWQGTIWMQDGNTAFFDRDWSLTPLGEAYRDLVLTEWRTQASLASDARGRAAVRGFHGAYTVTATAGERRGSTTLRLFPGGATARVVVR